MNKFILIPVIGMFSIFGISCYPTGYGYTNGYTERGMVVGGLVGAGTGALIGEHNDRELEGAAIGGVVGALTGGLLGSTYDQQYYPYYNAPRPIPYQTYPRYYRTPVVSVYPIYRSYSYNYGRGYRPHHHHSRSYGCR